MDDDRGNLALEFIRLAQRKRPQWLVWENVPGVLSSNGGRDFGSFLGALAEIGYGFAYRVLDAQFFGVAQRRRRVFVVGYLGDWRRAAAVLFERESMSGHPAPRREAGQEAAPTVTQGAPFSRTGNERVEAEAVVAQCLTTRTGSEYDPTTETLPIAFGAQNSANQGDSVSTEVTPTLDKSKTPAVAFGIDHDLNGAKELMGPLIRGPQGAPRNAISQGAQVRRLTPTECERLQGFPDNYTQIPWRNKAAKDCPDGPRYKAMGNSMAVPVMRWIGERIQMVESLDE
jgi:DNA (cytosine-5)-methyltransferase 1